MFHLTSILLLLLFTYQFIAQAADVRFVLPREEAPASCVDRRTLFSIIWGCVSTTIICAWAAIHPNIPPREGPFKATLRRLELMFWTIVAPEILPAWALNQRFAATTIRNLYNKEKGYKKESRGIWKIIKRWFSLYEKKEAASQAWTLKHGHFVIMGGIHLVEPVEATTGTERLEAASDAQSTASTPLVERTDADAENGPAPPGNKAELEEGRVTVLTLEILRELVKDPKFKIRITEDEIADRSKGDALSKTIFILQSTWFIAQCIARHIQVLDITQLELTTLALASLNGITFILWWHKPLGVQTVVPVYLNRKLTDAERNVRGGKSMRSNLVPFLRDRFEDYVTPIRDIIHCRSEANIFVAWLVQLPLITFALLHFPIVAFAFAFIFTVVDLVVGSTSFAADATHVPTFYVPEHDYPEYSHALLLLALASVFGGIHCAGWNFIFPTYAEQMLWRVASLAVTTIPIGLIPIGFIAFIIVVIAESLDILESDSDAEKYIYAGASVTATLMYASARLILLGQAIALLRHQPPSAFIALDTKFPPFF